MEEGIGELADSIAAVGLLQGLVVKRKPRGKFAVIAGRHRLLALSRLAEGGKVKPTMPVPCRIAPKDADLPEISLTENVMRVPVHPADEFEAFQRLILNGKSVADVAARFGVTEAVVLRRLALEPEIDHQAISRCRRAYAPELPLSAEAKAEIDNLKEERDNLVNQFEHDGDDAEDADGDPLYDRIDEIDRRIQAIRRNRKAAYPDEAKANCGVAVSIGHNGEPAFVYGLLRKEDEKAIATQETRTEVMQPTEAVPEPQLESPAYSAALIETLTQHKTAAIAAELSQHPAIALAALVHALVLSESVWTCSSIVQRAVYRCLPETPTSRVPARHRHS